MKNLRTSLISIFAAAAMAVPALADGRNPSSLFLFPLFEHGNMSSGSLPNLNTLVTITNTHPTTSTFVHFVFVSAIGSETSPCQHYNDQTRALSPLDTFSLLTNPFSSISAKEGFLYAFAVDRQAPPWRPVAFNYLIADVMILDGVISSCFSMNPVGFRAIENRENFPIGTAAVAPLPLLDGVMYSKAPDRILIPKFMGQGGDYESQLVLLSLAANPAGTPTPLANSMLTLVDFLIFNDNAEAFSAQAEFRCWKRLSLSSINGLFEANFLENFTNDNPNEIRLPAAALETVESGWMILQGNVSNASASQVANPAIMAVLIENSGSGEVTAELPFFVGERIGKIQP